MANNEVGTALLRIAPYLGEFVEELRAKIDTAQRDGSWPDAEVRVGAKDLAKLKAEVKAAIREMEAEKAEVRFDADTAEFTAKTRAAKKEASKKVDGRFDADTDGYSAQTEAAKERAARNVGSRLDADTAGYSAQTEAAKAAAAMPVSSDLDLNTGRAMAELRAFEVLAEKNQIRKRIHIDVDGLSADELVQQRMLSTYRDLHGRGVRADGMGERSGWVGMEQMREAMPDVSRQDFNRNMAAVQRQPGVSAIQQENRGLLNENTRRQAAPIGSQKAHLFQVEGDDAERYYRDRANNVRPSSRIDLPAGRQSEEQKAYRREQLRRAADRKIADEADDEAARALAQENLAKVNGQNRRRTPSKVSKAAFREHMERRNAVGEADRYERDQQVRDLVGESEERRNRREAVEANKAEAARRKSSIRPLKPRSDEDKDFDKRVARARAAGDDDLAGSLENERARRQSERLQAEARDRQRAEAQERDRRASLSPKERFREGRHQSASSPFNNIDEWAAGIDERNARDSGKSVDEVRRERVARERLERRKGSEGERRKAAGRGFLAAEAAERAGLPDLPEGRDDDSAAKSRDSEQTRRLKSRLDGMRAEGAILSDLAEARQAYDDASDSGDEDQEKAAKRRVRELEQEHKSRNDVVKALRASGVDSANQDAKGDEDDSTEGLKKRYASLRSERDLNREIIQARSKGDEESARRAETELRTRQAIGKYLEAEGADRFNNGDRHLRPARKIDRDLNDARRNDDRERVGYHEAERDNRRDRDHSMGSARVLQNLQGINLFNLSNIFQAGIGITSIVVALGGVIAAAGAAATALAAMGGVALVGGMKVFQTLSALMQANKTSLGQQNDAKAAKEHADALEKVAEAQKKAQTAAGDLADKQKALGDAYKDATRELRDQNMELEDAVLSQEGAAIAVARAQENLLEVQAKYKRGKASGLDLQEAQLGVKSAQHRLQQAQNTKEDATQDTASANVKGVAGSDTVKNAQKDVVRAQDDLTAALKAVRDAQLAAAEGSDKNNSSMNRFNELMAQLTPQGRDFVNQMRGLAGEFKGLQGVVESKMFDGLGATIANVARNQLPELKRGMGDLAGTMNTVLGDTFKTIDRTFTEFSGNGKFDSFLKSTQASFSGFAPFMDGFIRMLTELTIQVGPQLGVFFSQFGKFMSDGAQMWGQFGAQTMEGIGRFLPTINQLSSVLIPVAQIVMPVLEGALNRIVAALDKWSSELNGATDAAGIGFLGLIDALLPLLPTLLQLITGIVNVMHFFVTIMASIGTDKVNVFTILIIGALAYKTLVTAIIGMSNAIVRQRTAWTVVTNAITRSSEAAAAHGTTTQNAAGRAGAGVDRTTGKWTQLRAAIGRATSGAAIFQRGSVTATTAAGAGADRAGTRFTLLGRRIAIAMGAIGSLVLLMSMFAGTASADTGDGSGGSDPGGFNMMYLLLATMLLPMLGQAVSAFASSTAAAGLFGAVARGVSGAWAWIAALPGRIAASTVATNLASAATTAWQAVVRGAAIVWAFISSLPSKIAATTAAQWLLNAALTANPIGIVVMLIAGLIAALVLFFTKTEIGRKIWSSVWDGIKTVISGAWNTIKAIFGWFIDGWQNVLDFFKSPFSEKPMENFKKAISGLVDWLKRTFLSIRDVFTNIVLFPLKAFGFVLSKVPSIPGVSTTQKVHDFGVKLYNSADASTLYGRADGGDLKAVNQAKGVISGPGTATSDSILALQKGTGIPVAWVSTDEGIVNARAMQKYPGFFEAMNAGTLPRFADGGAFKQLGKTNWNNEWTVFFNKHGGNDPSVRDQFLKDHPKVDYAYRHGNMPPDESVVNTGGTSQSDLAYAIAGKDKPKDENADDVEQQKINEAKDRIAKFKKRKKAEDAFNKAWIDYMKDKGGNSALQDYLARNPKESQKYYSGGFPGDDMRTIDSIVDGTDSLTSQKDDPGLPGGDGNTPNTTSFPGFEGNPNPGDNTSNSKLLAAANAAVAAGEKQNIDVAVQISDPDSGLSYFAGKSGAFPSASVIKLLVAAAAAKAMDSNKLTSDQVLPLLNPMISNSSNEATNSLVDLLGGFGPVNQAGADLGIASTDAHLGRRLGVAVSGDDPNVMSAKGVDSLLTVFSQAARGKKTDQISKKSATMIVDAMKNQTVNTKFGATVDHASIAHKTGELGGASHDVGYFFDGERWLQVSILTNNKGSTDQSAGNEIIKAFAKDVNTNKGEPQMSNPGGSGGGSNPNGVDMDQARAKTWAEGRMSAKVPYHMGGFSDSPGFDCSGFVAGVVNMALTGDYKNGGRMATPNEGDWLKKRGALDGKGQAGDLRIGWWDGGTGGYSNGHTAGTFGDGTKFESGGGHGPMVGGSAVGHDDKQFTNHAYFSPKNGGNGGNGGGTNLQYDENGKLVDPSLIKINESGDDDKDTGPTPSHSISDAMLPTGVGDEKYLDIRRFTQNAVLEGTDIVAAGIADFFGLGGSLFAGLYDPSANMYTKAWDDSKKEQARVEKEKKDKQNKSGTGNVGNGDKNNPKTNQLQINYKNPNGENNKQTPTQHQAPLQPSDGKTQVAAGTPGAKQAVFDVWGPYGWTDSKNWDATLVMVNSESSWDVKAKNPKSTASGLFQFIDAIKKEYGYGDDAATQATGGAKYIKNRAGYGNPVAAKAFWDRNHWYAAGGFVSGPGTGTSDDIYAKLSNGEFVMRERATAVARPLFEALNASPALAGAVSNLLVPGSGGAAAAMAGGVADQAKKGVKAGFGFLSEFERSSLAPRQAPANVQMPDNSSSTSNRHQTVQRNINMGDVNLVDQKSFFKELEDQWNKQTIAHLGAANFK